jgi:hypothetical protein
VVSVPLTSNMRRANAPGNVLLSSERTGLPQDSVENTSLVAAIDLGSWTSDVQQAQCLLARCSRFIVRACQGTRLDASRVVARRYSRPK